MTAVRQPIAGSAVMAASTAPAPDMSFFMVAWVPSAGFRLMPPESYMIPLPTSVRCPVGSPSGR